MRILVVDDDKVNHLVIQGHLQGHPYVSTSTFDGKEALSLLLAGERPFDLVILDVMMPGMSGYDVCREIRKLYLPTELPIIMVTAQNEVADLVHGLDIGASDYLTKPFVKDEFLARIKTHLNLHRINTVTNRFVPSEFIHTLGRTALSEVKLGDLIEKEVTVCFSDIRDYTTLSEGMTPTENFRFVNAYAGRMGPIIQSHHGFVNQYLGDGIMAIFQGNPADALAAAIAMQVQAADYNLEREARNRAAIQMGIGLHTGPLVMGIIGDERRADAATISDSVNTASRMESLSKQVGAQILLSEESFHQLPDTQQYGTRYLGRIPVKGRREPVGIYECFDGDPPRMQELKAQTIDLFDQGIAHSLAKEYSAAAAHWEQVLAINPDDRVAAHFSQEAHHRLSQRAVPEHLPG